MYVLLFADLPPLVLSPITMTNALRTPSTSLPVLFAVLSISYQAIKVEAFSSHRPLQHVPTSLWMAPRFDKSTQKWFPADPEVS